MVFCVTASVSWPPSSYPTYPGGAPIRRDTEYFSMYSLMSIRTMLCLIVKQILRQCLGKLCFADTGRSKEQERSDRLGRILDTCFGTDNRFRDLRHAVILTDDTLVQLVIQMPGS